MEVINQSLDIRAKKEHQCDFCKQTIRKGDLYNNYFYKDGEPYSWKEHWQCSKLSDKFRNDNEYEYGEGMSHDDFIEHLLIDLKENYGINREGRTIKEMINICISKNGYKSI